MCFGTALVQWSRANRFTSNVFVTFHNRPYMFRLFHDYLTCLPCLFSCEFKLGSLLAVKKRQSFKLLEGKGAWKDIHEVETGPRHCGDQPLHLHWGLKNRTFGQGIQWFPNLAWGHWGKSVQSQGLGVKMEPGKRGCQTPSSQAVWAGPVAFHRGPPVPQLPCRVDDIT